MPLGVKYLHMLASMYPHQTLHQPPDAKYNDEVHSNLPVLYILGNVFPTLCTRHEPYP